VALESIKTSRRLTPDRERSRFRSHGLGLFSMADAEDRPMCSYCGGQYKSIDSIHVCKVSEA
jgi:hypothetical protein